MIITYKEPFTFMSNYTHKINGKCCYVGRLDPLASGISIFLTGDETKLQNQFMNLDKTYKFNLLIGMKTDTGDILGKITEFQSYFNLSRLDEILSSFHQKTYQQKYQIYSSIKIKKNGISKPLWYWAKEGNLLEEEIPEHEVKIYSLDWNKDEMVELTFKEMREDVLKMKVLENKYQNFRCDEILPQYEKMHKVLKLPCVAKVSSGTYIRQLGLDIGKELGIPCCVSEIERVGFHLPEEAMKGIEEVFYEI